MDSSLVATRIQIPPGTRSLVGRPRLVQAIERELPDHKLLVLSAPAGYGKTTLLAEWARSSRLQVVWLSVGEDTTDFHRFFRYLVRSWEQVRPSLGQTTLGLLLGAATPDRDAVLPAFINAAANSPAPTVFVLDDCHFIVDPAVITTLALLIDNLPPHVHVVMAGRVEPDLPLARLRARGELLDLRASDLGFQPDETAAFLRHSMGLSLSDDEVTHLHDQLEGWVAGLQLVGLSLQRGLTAPNVATVGGSHRFIADFLTDDVLADLAEDIRRFLLQTSILDGLCGPLCDAVTVKEGGQERLETLERQNLFLVPLDDRRAWFRYHRLFADFLRQELDRRFPEEVEELHRRAARWYLVHDVPDQAFEHAVAGDDPELVMEIGEHHFELKLLGGEYTVLSRWLESLPARWRADYPLIGLMEAGVLLFTGAIDAGVRLVDEVERRLIHAKPVDRRRHLARVTAVRCAIACFQNDLPFAEAFAAQALRELAADDHVFRSAIHHALGDTYRHNGRWDEAERSYLNVLTLVDEPAFRIRTVHVFSALADLEVRRGRLRQAAAYWRRSLDLAQQPAQWGAVPLPLIGWIFIRLGEILFEWNELLEAGSYVTSGLERAELGGDVRVVAIGRLIASRLALAQGDDDTAAANLELVRPPAGPVSLPEWSGRFERAQVALWLAQGRLRTAVAWSEQIERRGALPETVEGDETRLALAHVLILKGGDPSIARSLEVLERLVQEAEADGRVGIQIGALALQALAYRSRDDQVGALTTLERALRLAEPEGYVRLFADLGLPAARLLQEARRRGVMPDYVERLLAAFGVGAASSALERRGLPEPLSPREQDVLHLIASGLTNREIADALVISAETVKKHTASIFGKLGVRRRTEAVARAREFDLLDER